jgi:fructose-specific phosphotransferase system component IIB
MTNIYLDENLSEYVAQALNFLNKGYFRDIQVYSTKEKFGKGVADEIIIPGIGKADGVLITRDINIHKTRFQFDLCKQHKIGVFFLTLPKGLNKHWEMIRLLIEKWEEIVEKSINDRKPFAYRIRVVGNMQRM